MPICRLFRQRRCARTPDGRNGWRAPNWDHAEPPRRRDEPVPAPARPQPGRLVPVGRRCAGPREAARSADLPLDRLRRLPLVPRHGARVVRGRDDRGLHERPLRGDQGGPRGAPRPRPALHGRRPGDDRAGRLADVGLPDPRRPAVLRRHVLPGRAAPRDAVLPPGARRRRAGLARAARRGRIGGLAAGRDARRAAADRGGRAPRTIRRRRCSTRPRRDRRQLRPGQRRLGPRPEVPAADDRRVPAPADGRRRPRARGGRPRSTSRRWPTAASTTSSAAASTGTRPTRSGSSRTSSRCSTTTRSSRGSTCTPGRGPATRATARSPTGALDYLVRELTTADGAFAASQDADTDGVEGLTFTWTRGRDPRGPRRRRPAVPRRVRRHRRRELGGDTILSRVWPDAHTPPPSRADAAFEAGLAASRARLLERRASRPQPARDDKALAAWNGLAIAAFADAGRLLARERPHGRRRRAPPRRSPAASSRRTAPRAGRGRTAGPPARASSRTTRISPRACWRCTRRPSTSAGSRRPGR